MMLTKFALLLALAYDHLLWLTVILVLVQRIAMRVRAIV